MVFGHVADSGKWLHPSHDCGRPRFVSACARVIRVGFKVPFGVYRGAMKCFEILIASP